MDFKSHGPKDCRDQNAALVSHTEILQQCYCLWPMSGLINSPMALVFASIAAKQHLLASHNIGTRPQRIV